LTQTVYGDRCNTCGEPYTPNALKKRGGWANIQCRCMMFGGENDVDVLLIDDQNNVVGVVGEVPLIEDTRR
jgi:hypothetical protein